MNRNMFALLTGAIILGGVFLMAKPATAFQMGTGSSTEVSTVSGTLKSTTTSSDTHQGVEVLVSSNGGVGLEQVGTYDVNSANKSVLNGSVVDQTTTYKSFSFFDQ